MNEINGICPACFKGNILNGHCPVCGFVNDYSSGQKGTLPWYSILHGSYQTGRVLGVGGFGVTYAARSLHTGALCCIKEHMPEKMAQGRERSGALMVPREYREEFERGKERFLEEARILKQMQENVTVVNIWDFFEQNGTAYFVMEYLDGENMRIFQQKHTSRREELLTQSLKMLLSVGSALMEVHRFGLIHGDISPENIILTRAGDMKLIDFGAARTFENGGEIRQGKIYLKSGYAPYEQHTLKGRIGPWTDIYSLAATYYALVTGRKIPDARERIKQDEYRSLGTMCGDIDQRLTRVIDKALAVDYRERYQSMKEFLEEVSATLPGEEKNKPGIPNTSTEAVSEEYQEEPQPAEKKGFRFFGKNKKTQTKPRVYLEMYTKGGAVHSWALQSGVKYTVGRHPSCQLILPPDERLSRNHCTIQYLSGKDYILLTDYSSRGTCMENGRRLPKEETVKIRIGDYFYMAVQEFRFRVVEDEAW